MESQLKVLTTRHSSEHQREPDVRPLLQYEPKFPEAEAQILGPSQSIEEMEKQYAAFVRHDVYGRMGRGKLRWTQKLLMVPGLVVLVPVRVVAGVTILVSYYAICRVCTAFVPPNREGEQEDYAHLGGWRRAVLVRAGKFLSRAMLFVFGFFRVPQTCSSSNEGLLNDKNVSSDLSEGLESPGAIISNHVSYIDILYHMSSSFPSFVAKRSVGKLPFIGLISKCLGCVYVQRELKSLDFKGVSGIVNKRIQEAHQNKFAPKMMIFPEGTTTNGDYLLPFKTGAFLAKAPVLPVILRYPFQRFSPAWDSISGMRHVILLLSQFVNYIEVKRLPVYYPSEQEKEDPKLYAANVRKLMAHEGGFLLLDIGLAEKRVYHAALNGLFSQR